ncbi:MAG: hypothetical protein GC178_02020 [Flavobacteriales bacterium]|nr:hypothetical protein [Flavobacteriales bacterium]
MELQLKIIGWLFVVLALVHVVFPKYFNWKEELAPLSLINRQLMYVHSFFIAFVVLLMGILCITSSYELTGTKLGRTVSLGLSIFWGVRLVFQFFGYSPKVWKGKSFETFVHIVFSIFWIYVTAVFTLTFLGNN